VTARLLTEAEFAELNDLIKHGLLHPKAVLDRASNPKSALHNRFTWDDTKAARLWRLNEAQRLVTQVKVELQPRPDEPPVKVRAFVSLANDRVDGGGYRPIATVLEDASLREQLLQTALAELQALQKRYKHLSELAIVFAELDRVVAKQQRKRIKRSA